MRKIKCFLGILCVLMIALGADSVYANTIRFDDLSTTKTYATITGPYDGFSFSQLSVFYETFQSNLTDGFYNAAVSGEYSAVNYVRNGVNQGGFAPATIASDELFDFTGANLTGIYRDNLIITASGYLDGQLKYQEVVTTDTEGEWFDFAFLEVNSVSFAASEGDDSPYGRYFGLDDFTYTRTPAAAATPEPGTLLLLGSGLVSLGIVHRRRKQSFRK